VPGEHPTGGIAKADRYQQTRKQVQVCECILIAIRHNSNGLLIRRERFRQLPDALIANAEIQVFDPLVGKRFASGSGPKFASTLFQASRSPAPLCGNGVLYEMKQTERKLSNPFFERLSLREISWLGNLSSCPCHILPRSRRLANMQRAKQAVG
jgi:hypothetical protein